MIIRNSNDRLIIDILNNAENFAKKARKYKHSLSGGGFYASKFLESQAEATLIFRRLTSKLGNYDDPTIKNALLEIEKLLTLFFDPKVKVSNRSEPKKHIFLLYKTVIEPILNSTADHTPTDNLFPLDIVRDTRGYIERVAEQACGSYDYGWYDAASAMIRRLIETLIIEIFEAHKLEQKIKNNDGNYFYLSGLIQALLKESTLTLGRDAKKYLPKLKNIGDLSVHSRRYLAKIIDLDNLKSELRIVLEELVYISKLRK